MTLFIEQVHFTDPTGANAILGCGYLDGENGTYFTALEVQGLPPRQRATHLGLKTHERSRCAFICDLPIMDMRTPPEGPLTVGQLPQVVIYGPIPLDACTSNGCEELEAAPQNPWPWLIGIGLVGLALYAESSKHAKAVKRQSGRARGAGPIQRVLSKAK